MSFASQAREEIARRSLQKDCCVRAAAYGFACFAKYFDAKGLVLQTEQALTAQGSCLPAAVFREPSPKKSAPAGWYMSLASVRRNR